jgi:CheY-like chemotaxis protein/HPt (histidine-containing phosphotransfer) domain-containing protein
MMTALDPMLDVTKFPAGEIRNAEVTMSMLAHDIRGALQGVVGGVAALGASPLPPELTVQIDRIAAASRALESLISIAIEGPAIAEEALSHRVELSAFLDFLNSRWRGEAQANGMDFSIALEAGSPAGMRVPHFPLARLLGNLISNAIRHARTGTVRLAVGPGPDGGLIVRVGDQGPGINPALLERLSGAASVPPPDVGLGLRIVRDLAGKLGCGFTLVNAARGGVEATITVPADLCVASSDHGFETEGVRAPTASATDNRHALAGLRVLLAEDNQTNQMVATQMLSALGMEVTVCSDGAEALEVFETDEFDLLLVDIEMPRVSGLDVIRRIRGRGDARATVPMVALTAYALREHRDRIAEAGADGLISKPITSVDSLAQGIAAHVGRVSAGETVSAPDAPPAAAGPAVDLGVYNALRDAIGADMAELLDKVVADLLSAREDLAGALSPLDRGAIRSASHILISVAGAIGAVRLQAQSRSLNGTAHEPGYRALEADVRSVILEIDAAVAFARDARAEL